MAGTKEIKGRIVSVKNTRKITRTMEMVSTAKSKRMTDRVNAAKPYGEKIAELMDTLGGLKGQVESPLLRAVSEPKRIAVLVVTANRGLCGGYNANTLKLARKVIEDHKAAGREVEVHMVGKKGAGFFKFVKIPVAKTYLNVDDKFEYSQAEELAEYFMDEFSANKLDKVEIVSTQYHNSSSQTPGVTPVLPVGGGAVAKTDEDDDDGEGPAPKKRKTEKGYNANAIYEPSPELILKKLLPLTVKSIVYTAMLEAVTSEQIARRIAMKNATDNAGEMQKMLTRKYNRARQASITQELSEIVAGADAVG